MHQIYNAGARSLIIIMLSGLFVGMVLGLQGFDLLQRFGSEDALGVAAALGLLKELGPVVTALLFAGRAGTSLTSEIGLMRATDQLTAMEMMAVDPMRYVVAPRFLGGVIAMPLLAAIFNVIGLFGAQLVGVQLMGVDAGAFWSQMQGSVRAGRCRRKASSRASCSAFACSLIAVYEGYHARAHRRRRGTCDHAHRGRVVGAHAAARLHADRGLSVRGTFMRPNRTLEIGTGLFVLLGFAALAFLTTQLPGSGLKLGGAKTGYHVMAKFDNIGDLKAGLAGLHGGRAHRRGREHPLRSAGLQGGRHAAHRPAVQPDSGRQRREHPDPGPARRQVRRHRPGRLGDVPEGRQPDRIHAVGHRAREPGEQVLRELREQGQRLGRTAERRQFQSGSDAGKEKQK